MKKEYQFILFLLFAVVLTTACSKDDDYNYPNVLTEFTDLKTDAKGTAYALVTDNNKTFLFDEISSLSKLTPDSTYRIISKFVPNADKVGYATLYYTKSVIAPIPVSTKFFKKIKTDPVKLQSISIAGNYINIAINILKKDRKHLLHFMQDSIINESDNKKSLYISLYHDKNNDIDAFYETDYLSIPLWAYQNILTKGDSVIIKINTYKDGIITKKFTI